MIGTTFSSPILHSEHLVKTERRGYSALLLFEPRHDKTNKAHVDLSLRWAQTHFVGFVMTKPTKPMLI